MKRFSVPILMVILVLSLPALAGATVISLPALAGGFEWNPFQEPTFGYPGIRTMSFTLPDSITAIEEMALVVSGEWTAGILVCEGTGGPPVTSPLLPGLSMFINSDGFPGDFFSAGVSVPDGPFEELTDVFHSCCPPGILDLNDLIGQELEVEFFIDLAILGVCTTTLDTYGIVDDVSLRITGTVASEHSSWSRVKSLYR